MKTIDLNADFCVVGAGPAGMCAALAAARQGLKTILIHDRPVPGGNASSEIRMWICGAQGDDCRETGILEEMMLENFFRNPKNNPSIWDSVLYGKLCYAENLQMLLNCSCFDLQMSEDGRNIVSIRSYQSINQTFYRICAPLFADCSGDSILAALSGAETRYGRESAVEFSESIQPETADRCTMGSSCLIQVREHSRPVKFTSPDWAYQYRSPSDLPGHRDYTLSRYQNFWYLEVGGEEDVVHQSDSHREELLKIAFGVWDYMKNYAPNHQDNANWELDWIGFLPGKRESLRYCGDYTMTQNDITTKGVFPDVAAYGGWTMDDHHPGGFAYPGPPTIFHPAPSPFGIPYRCMYSRNIDNLFCAGRNISLTHAALAAARVMGSCAAIGQAVGIAAAIAGKNHLSPRQVGNSIEELQQLLLDDDCFLPGLNRQIPKQTSRASLRSSNSISPEPLRDGIDRPTGSNIHAWLARPGDHVEYHFDQPEILRQTRLVFDSDLNRLERNMAPVRRLDTPDFAPPATLVKDFDLDYLDDDGNWQSASQIRGNYQRLRKLDLNIKTTAVRLKILNTHGKNSVRVFAWDIC